MKRFVVVLCLAGSAHAQAPQMIKWFDGARERSAWMSPSQVTTFGVHTSPVFHDDASGEGPRRALPGGIIVFFKPDWDDARIRRFLADQGLAGARKLNIAGNVYSVPTAPGLPALATANRIDAFRASGEVTGAAPNWWQDRSLR